MSLAQIIQNPIEQQIEYQQIDDIYSCKCFDSVQKQTKIIQHENGNMYEGQVIDDVPHGFGSYYYRYDPYKYQIQFTTKLGAVQFRYRDYYIGGWKNGRRQGKGFLFQQEDNKGYEGVWKNGQLLSRKVTIYDTEYPAKNTINFVKTYKGGYRYKHKGIIIKSKQGKGKQYTKDGKILYFGYFKNGYRQGQGILYHRNGKKQYEGTFKMGYKSGSGTLYAEDGEVIYVGDWDSGYWKGEGELFYQDGLYYKGHFQYGKKSGYGKLSRKNGAVIYEGQWFRDLKNGKGTLYYQNGNIQYSGQWVLDKRDGKGAQYFENAKIDYNGQWSQDRRQGQGKQYYENGNISYQGGWKDNERNGEGAQYNTNGIITYYGEWRGGKQEGKRARYLQGKIYYEEKANEQEIFNIQVFQSKNVDQINRKIRQVYNEQKDKYFRRLIYKIIK